MKFINVSYEEFVAKKNKRKVIHFGVSATWHYYLKAFHNIKSEVLEDTIFVVDNDSLKQGTEFEIAGKFFEVKKPECLRNVDNYVILITVSMAYQKSICQQLLEMNLPMDTECYSLPLMTYSEKKVNNDCVDEYFKRYTYRVNVSKIHCFWFSGEEKPELYKRCLDSWYRFCPEFEIIEWNTQNYDVTKNRYMKEAFERHKWAFVSDYARLDVLHTYGGIYMDMDVELLTSPVKLLNAKSFFCRQEDGFIELGSGFGAQAGDPLILKMLETYEDRKLIKEDGSMDMTPQPEWLSEVMKEYGLGRCYDSQIVDERLILSNDYITCATGENPTKNAKIGVHWHNGGWLDDRNRKLIRDSLVAKGELIEKYFND